jgi:hypothetical protein
MEMFAAFVAGMVAGGAAVAFRARIRAWLNGEVTVLVADGKVAVTGVEEHVTAYFKGVATKFKARV